jgi:hypothetical protein
MLATIAPWNAIAAPYCATYSDGAVNCGFYSMWSCRAAISGVGGNCSVNAREFAVPDYRLDNRYVGPSRRRHAYRAAPPCRVYLGFGRWTDCD